MASPVAVLCVFLLSACGAHAGRPARQFEEVIPDQAACMQDGVSYPIGASVPDDDPCTFGCFCAGPENIICAVAKSPRSCAFYQPPCVDAMPVYDPSQCCTTWECPNGPNCPNPLGDPRAQQEPIPEGQAVDVNGERCYCAMGGRPAVCTAISP